MLKCNHIENFSILIIDDNEEFNTQLSFHLKQYGYELDQVFSEEEAFSYIDHKLDDYTLVILNIDIQSTDDGLFEYIQANTGSKIVLLSGQDLGTKRESYFQSGILDFYPVTKKIHHISDDIHNAIGQLDQNKRESILIIDSSQELTQKLKNILEQRSYNILVANNAQDGLEILKRSEISVLILDLELPDVHGLKVLEGLRDLYLLDEFFVLVTSSLNDPALVRDTLKGGAKNFLKKPFLYEEFLLKIDLLVKGSKERKLIYEQKKEIENNLRIFQELLHSTINPMFIFEDNVCIDYNKEAIELLEMSRYESIKGKHIEELFTSITKEHQEELIDNEIDHYFEDGIKTKSGNYYDVQIKERNTIINRKLLKIISIMDITEIKRNEKIISQQSKMASMGEMIGNIAHQWRQPLTAISVAASGIKLSYELDMEEKEDTMRELDNIVKNTQFLSNTIEDFQNFLKNNRTLSQFFIGNVIKKTLSIISANLESQDIEVILELNNDIQIEGVQNDLMQVLLNIINNSVDALKKVEDCKRIIFISLEFLEEKTLINLYDSAGGISCDIIENIFEPYFTTKHQSQGTGLGLYMTHQIIDRIGGGIEVQNDTFCIQEEEYKGAKFTVSIPCYFT